MYAYKYKNANTHAYVHTYIVTNIHLQSKGFVNSVGGGGGDELFQFYYWDSFSIAESEAKLNLVYEEEKKTESNYVMYLIQCP